MSNKRKRSTYEQQSVFTYQQEGETAAAAKARLDAEWRQGQHLWQLQQKEKE